VDVEQALTVGFPTDRAGQRRLVRLAAVDDFTRSLGVADTRDPGRGDDPAAGLAQRVAPVGLPDELLPKLREVVVEPPGVVDPHTTAQLGERERLLRVRERPEDGDTRLVAQHGQRVGRIRFLHAPA
jgi:hypothetical protein